MVTPALATRTFSPAVLAFSRWSWAFSRAAWTFSRGARALAWTAALALLILAGHSAPALAARPHPLNRGDCYQWSGCRGESIGNMPTGHPDNCGPLGGKSWRAGDGRCLELPVQPWPADDPEAGQEDPARDRRR